RAKGIFVILDIVKVLTYRWLHLVPLCRLFTGMKRGKAFDMPMAIAVIAFLKLLILRRFREPGTPRTDFFFTNYVGGCCQWFTFLCLLGLRRTSGRQPVYMIREGSARRPVPRRPLTAKRAPRNCTAATSRRS